MQYPSRDGSSYDLMLRLPSSIIDVFRPDMLFILNEFKQLRCLLMDTLNVLFAWMRVTDLVYISPQSTLLLL